ncbi:NAD kinase 2 [Actinidia rufa]|uniref:NAD kinase 2 n=1 Tax=Actinidia rufa TaxID=165716 RepID=A0A7J0FD51_9ERIC|nr:NAD kinase 2 [Actinidia rufa]
MVCLLNKGKEDVLSGRSSMLNTFHVTDINVRDDKLPPFAIFRGEMKRYCESLHVALENYLTPDDNRSLSVWRKLQRLKSVCYDSGFPRGDGDPCHTLFANWNPVYLSTSKEDIYTTDSEVAFWRGSQVTEEGLKWLMEKGFKTIVDLRAEAVQDDIYETALEDAIFFGKVELVKLPVEVGTAPSSEQVEKFAALVSNSRKNAIYLHSREGVWRTSAMVSRWRQYMARYASQLVSNHATTQRDKMEELSTSNLEEDAFVGDGNGLLPKQLGMTRDNTGKVLNHMSLGTDNKDLPPCNVFSRKEMSRFFKNNKMPPPAYFNYHQRKLKACYPQRENFNGTFLGSEIIGTSPELQLMETGSKNGSTSSKTLALKSHSPPVSKETYLSDNGHSSSDPNLNGFGKGERYPVSAVTNPLNVSNGLYKNVISITDDQKHNSEAFTVPGDDGLGMIEGDMCASATGVIRIQSRRKVEMFLVRTDGFSCSREKVTESSLAFTHPSTQQQMLIWKSTPKTVLLLKKLGQELMEEAKEVASFLYHQEKLNVLVEPDVHDIFARIPGFGFVQTFYSQDTSKLHERVDFVACLGGDGVILHASNLFRGAVPPVVSFNLGSLGFLTSHNFEDFRQDLQQVVHGNNTLDGVYITLRMRLRCEIFRNGRAMPGKVFDVLNEVVVDRGSNPYISKLECYEHDRLITKVQGDGVIVATPTGSTAYSTAAGGSMDSAPLGEQ